MSSITDMLGNLGGGLWHPEAQPIAALRTDIDQRPHRLKDVLMDPKMRKEFLGGVPKNEEKTVNAFVSARMNADNALKTKPKVSKLNKACVGVLQEASRRSSVVECQSETVFYSPRRK